MLSGPPPSLSGGGRVCEDEEGEKKDKVKGEKEVLEDGG